MASSMKLNYSTVIIDMGSGLIKSGFGGEDGPRSIFSSVVGVPKKLGILVGMEAKERFVGNEAIEKVEMMNFINPIKRGEVVDWEKFETLLHYLFYSELKIVPEEASILISECPLSLKENRRKLSELLFETFSVEKIHIANSSMLGLYSYGKSIGLVVDSGFNVTSTVPIYEGYPLTHASIKINFGGEDISKNLLSELQKNESFDKSYEGMKGLLLADKIKEERCYVYLDKVVDELDSQKEAYTLPDNKTIELGSELFKSSNDLFSASSNSEKKDLKSCVITSIEKCDNDIKNLIKENICLTGGTTLLKNFNDKLRNQLSESTEGGSFKVESLDERQFSAWIGGSIVSSLSNFSYMWVSKNEYDEFKLDAIDSKCF